MIEDESQRTIGTQVTPPFVKDGPDVRHGPGIIVGKAFDKDGYAPGSITFETYFVEIGPFIAGFVDGPVNVILGHIDPLGILYGQSKPGIAFDGGPTFLDGHLDFFDNARKDFPALGIEGSLLAFNG
jgi:hypothetical protein